ncbi:hypothetical protein SCHPADRAFT_634372 [Schizopora paradoxa]|uniref:Uncharacterized protein n=1 Tax=Schizopora paradoxa TaxID=27342 RepID=A0A0H2R7C4_9AGAM|nr:hypothetical protein SCHPADRAFT_634372 [Schizopora paradoxa]
MRALTLFRGQSGGARGQRRTPETFESSEWLYREGFSFQSLDFRQWALVSLLFCPSDENAILDFELGEDRHWRCGRCKLHVSVSPCKSGLSSLVFKACLRPKSGIIGTIYQERSRMSCSTTSLCLICILMRCDHSISPGTIEDRRLPIKSLSVLSIHHRSMAQHDEASRTGHPRQGNIGGAVPSAGHFDHVNFDGPLKTCGRFICSISTRRHTDSGSNSFRVPSVERTVARCPSIDSFRGTRVRLQSGVGL